MTDIVLKKGEMIKFLDYEIFNCLNNDGLVLSKKRGVLYETHLGNYGDGTQDDIDYCKKSALVYFMLARPEVFATSLCHKITKLNSGTYHEYFLLRNCLKDEGLEMPGEITGGDGMNCMIYFKGKPLTKK